MKVWKSNIKPARHDIWVSEIRLRECDVKREDKVNKLLKLLKKEVLNATVS